VIGSPTVSAAANEKAVTPEARPDDFDFSDLKNSICSSPLGFK
jgi:hypothetical protein